jgi:hypothetical protein
VTEHLIEIFRPGRRVTGLGEVIEFSESDIATTAAAFDPRRGYVPLVIGHPASNSPSVGDTLRLSAVGGSLYALVRPAASLVGLVRSGAYRHVSAAFHRPSDSLNPVPGAWYLRHIGFLGATPPAVKGMAAPQFCETSFAPVCFAEFDGAHSSRHTHAAASITPRHALHRIALGFQQDCPGLSYLDAARLAESGRRHAQ